MHGSLFHWRLAPLLFLLFYGCGSEQAEREGNPVDETRGAGVETQSESTGPILAYLGDSISAGLHHDPEYAFPAVLRELLAEEGIETRLINGGVSGDTTAGGLRRVGWLLAQQPEYVVVELGGNDGLRGVPLDSIDSNLRAILEKIREAGSAAILLGARMPPNYGADYTLGFEAIYKRLAQEYELAFVPFFLEGVGGVPELNLEDGLHPTREGHRQIARHLLPTFRDQLNEAGP
ncbi:MAG: acyl-CoA thioesterase-1 [Planctomycetota bacterium]|jgi:acyl-CoA thioesterase-1